MICKRCGRQKPGIVCSYCGSRRRASIIIRLRNEGYRIWRIAELAECSANDVMEILIDAGIEKLETCELVLQLERKMTREERKKRLARMRARRKRENQARRIGGGNWSGR